MTGHSMMPRPRLRSAHLGWVGLALAGCGRLAGIDDIRYGAPNGIGDAGSEASAEPEASAEADANAEPDATIPETAAGQDASDGGGSASSDDADADDVPDSEPGWSPLELGPALVLWLDGSRVVPNANGYVETWSDRSIYGNDAHGSLQSPPSYARKGAPNAHGAVEFDGSMNYLSIADAPSLRWGEDDFLVEVVAAYANAPTPSEYTGYANFYNKTSASGPFYGVSFMGNGFRSDVDGATILAAAAYASVASRGWVSNPSVADVAGAST